MSQSKTEQEKIIIIKKKEDIKIDFKNEEQIHQLREEDLLTKWEYKFLLDIINYTQLTEKQEKKVANIKRKVINMLKD